MITFQNISTGNTFTLPDDKAKEIIKASPDIYKIISGAKKDLSILPADTAAPIDLTKNIYSLVVADEEVLIPDNFIKKSAAKKQKRHRSAKLKKRRSNL